LIIALSFSNLNNLFFGFPICGSGVIVPTSTKPNPKLLNSLICAAFLSNPAATPTGFLKFNPNNCFSSFGSSRDKKKRNYILCQGEFER
jgi:hypothetical protein